jgi:hypothetical protein
MSYLSHKYCSERGFEEESWKNHTRERLAMSSLYHFLWRLQLTALRCQKHPASSRMQKRYGPLRLLGLVPLSFDEETSRDDAKMSCPKAKSLEVKYKILCEGVALLLAEKTQHD